MSLAQRLGRGALPIAEVLRLGTQIADALGRAGFTPSSAAEQSVCDPMRVPLESRLSWGPPGCLTPRVSPF
jgi:hypothetical protein